MEADQDDSGYDDDDPPRSELTRTRAGGLHRIVGTAVKGERVKRGWSQQKLADMLQKGGSSTLTRNALASIESGYRKVDIEEAFFLARVLKLGLAELIQRGVPGDTMALTIDDDRLVGLYKVLEVIGGPKPKTGPTYADLADLDDHVRQIAQKVAENVVEAKFSAMINKLKEAEQP